MALCWCPCKYINHSVLKQSFINIHTILKKGQLSPNLWYHLTVQDLEFTITMVLSTCTSWKNKPWKIKHLHFTCILEITTKKKFVKRREEKTLSNHGSIRYNPDLINFYRGMQYQVFWTSKLLSKNIKIYVIKKSWTSNLNCAWYYLIKVSKSQRRHNTVHGELQQIKGSLAKSVNLKINLWSRQFSNFFNLSWSIINILRLFWN